MINKKAFSLIELMVVLTISAIIAAFAIPSYKDYVNRAKIVSMLALVEPCFNQVYQYFFKNGTLPNGLGDQSVSCQGITLTMSPQQFQNPNTKVRANYSLLIDNNKINGFVIKLVHDDLRSVGTSSAYGYDLYALLEIDSQGDLNYTCGFSETNRFSTDLKPSNCQ